MRSDTAGKDKFEPIGNVDKIIHEPARLSIMAHLYVVESADFTFIMRQTGLTRGNLSSHMSKLEAAGYIEVEKKFVKRKPLTVLHLTVEGRVAFRDYRRRMMKALDELPG